jgi:hypothetical protein
MSTHRSWPLLGLAILLSAGTARGVDRFVARGGSDSGTCSVSSAPCGSLGYALTQAASGDTVKMGRGSFPGDVTIDASTSLTISGGWSVDFASRNVIANRTSLRGIPGRPCSGCRFTDVIVVRASTGDVIALTLDGLTIRHGTRGVFAIGNDDGVLDLEITDCVVQGNLGSGVVVDARDTSVVTADVSATLFKGNISAAEPFQGNGAGVRVDHTSSAPMTFRLADSRLERNRAVGNTYGGGMRVGSISTSAGVALRIERSMFSRNRNIGGAAAALSVSGPITLIISDTTFTRNSSQSIGAIYLNTTTDFTLSNVTITGNVNSVDSGGVVDIGVGTGTIVNTTISGNKGGAAAVVAGSGTGLSLTLRNTILWGQRPATEPDLIVGSATVNADHNDIGILVGTVNDLGGNINADPLFADAGLRLSAGSPCIDGGTCTGAPATDAEGDPRPSGTTCDIGADEFIP